VKGSNDARPRYGNSMRWPIRLFSLSSFRLSRLMGRNEEHTSQLALPPHPGYRLPSLSWLPPFQSYLFAHEFPRHPRYIGSTCVSPPPSVFALISRDWQKNLSHTLFTVSQITSLWYTLFLVERHRLSLCVIASIAEWVVFQKQYRDLASIGLTLWSTNFTWGFF